MVGVDVTAWDPSTWSALGTWLTAGIYVAILVYAARQVKEARSLREEQVRPFVVVDFDVDWLTDLRIENAGRTLAHNVKVAFDPPLTSTLSRPWPWEKSPLFEQGVPTLAPGKAIRVPFDAYNERSEAQLPMTYKVTVTYSGHKSKKFEDTYILDLSIYEGTAPPPDGIPQLIKALERIGSEIRKWTDGIRGIQVHVVDKERATRRDHRHIWIERARRVRVEKGNIAFVRYLVERFFERRGWIRRR